MLLFTTVNIYYTKIVADIIKSVNRDLNITFTVSIYEDIGNL